MSEKKEPVMKKKHKINRKSLLIALPIYILYVLIVEVYLGFGVGELWDRWLRYMGRFKKYLKNRNKSRFIRIKI